MKYQANFNAEFLHQHQPTRASVYMCVDVEKDYQLTEKSAPQLIEIIKNTFSDKSHLKLYFNGINRNHSNNIKQEANTIEFYSYINYNNPVEEVRKFTLEDN